MTASDNGTPAKDFLSDGPSPFSLSTLVAPLAGMIRTVVPAAGERIRLAFVDVISAVHNSIYRNALLVTIAAGSESIGTIGAGSANIGFVQSTPREILSDRLSVTADQGTDTLAAPGAGFAYRIYGYAFSIVGDNPTIDLQGSFIKGLTSVTYIGRINAIPSADSLGNMAIFFGDNYLELDENEAVTLTGLGFSAGACTTICTVYYTKEAV